MSKYAFTLIELAIVLVIVGLLTGGVLGGQSLIHAAQMRSITTDHERYLAAAQAFDLKYGAIPGDITNATNYWGKSATYCSGQSGSAGSPGTCNGNGNGMMDRPGGPGQTGESYQFWNQLALAGLIEGSYTGASTNCPQMVFDCTTQGVNVPITKRKDAVWYLGYTSPDYGGDMNGGYAANYGNYMLYGQQTSIGGMPGGILTPEEMWNIDVKFDDGKPGSGSIMTVGWNGNCAIGGADPTDVTNSVYNLSSKVPFCPVYFSNQF